MSSDFDSVLISFVASSRNDDHGGNLLRRMQHFVDCLDSQCNRFNLSAELVLVEWNPPSDKPKLMDELKWPCDGSKLKVRIIEVPEYVHAQFEHSATLPLYQMIAKNVGIRRARGKFIVATNIDVIFSDPLMRALSSSQIKERRIYRADRHDIDPNLPGHLSMDEKLEWCRNHVIRVHSRSGSKVVATGDIDYIHMPMSEKIKRYFLSVLLWWGIFWRALQNRRHSKIWKLFKSTLGYHFFLSIRCFKYIYLGNLPRGRRLHTNACGDFTLMSKRDWENINGYWELDAYSFHIDSLGCHSAVASGCKEVCFDDSAVLYHIEHSVGSGFTTENSDKLWDRLDSNRVKRISNEEYGQLSLEIDVLKRDFRLNSDDWGLLNDQLPETRPVSSLED